MGKTIKGVTHKRTKDGMAVCGISLFGVKKSNATFRGVTCKRCLRVKNKKVVKTVRKVKARITPSARREFPSGKLQ